MSERRGVWTTKGFEAFRRGSFGNAGQNIYVSRAGVLQRIHQFDLNGNGYLDLVFCNDHPHREQTPIYIYTDPLNTLDRVEVPSEGARAGVLADLNGDGYDDLVLGIFQNGERFDVNALVYYGSPEGFSERRQQLLPAPHCVSVAVGDFNGDGRPDLAFLCHRGYDPFSNTPIEPVLRIFYQTELGFELKRFFDIPMAGEHIAAADLDGDGFSDLVLRSADGEVTVMWGGGEGLSVERADTVPVDKDGDDPTVVRESFESLYSTYIHEATPLAGVVELGGRPHVFVARRGSASLVPVGRDRRFRSPIVLECTNAMSVDVGDVNGNGHEDIVVASREEHDGGECSWVYWGGAAHRGQDHGFSQSRRTRLASDRACDVVVVDLNGNSHADVVFSQDRSMESFDTDSLVYRGAAGGVESVPVRLPTHDAHRVFVTRVDGGQPGLAFINQYGRARIHNSAPIYFGGPDGFSPQRRLDVAADGSTDYVSCDLNDDGLPDLILSNIAHDTGSGAHGSYLLINDARGFPTEPTRVLPTTRGYGLALADFDKNGYLDLVVSGNNLRYLTVFTGTADGFDTENPQRIMMEHDGITYDNALWPYLADLNDDGWLDLIVPQIRSDRSFILWGGPDGFSLDRRKMLSVHRAGCARVADLNGNGFPDLILGGAAPTRGLPHDSFAYIYWNGPDGLSEDRKTLLPANHINAMAVADFNNSGSLDLFVCSYDDNRQRDLDSYFYWNRDGRGFSAADRTRIFAHCASGCIAADFNEDGWTDLAIAYHKVDGDHVGESEVWWNGPEGFDARRTTGLPTVGPHGMNSVGPGNVIDRGPEEYTQSAPHLLPEGVSVTGVDWTGETPPKTWVKAQVRVAESEHDLDSSPWGDRWIEEGGEAPETGRGRWAQFRLALGAVNGGRSPRITRVDVHYAAP